MHRIWKTSPSYHFPFVNLQRKAKILRKIYNQSFQVINHNMPFKGILILYIYSTAQIQASALTRFKCVQQKFVNAFFVELISMYELAYCSWCIVVSAASTKG